MRPKDSANERPRDRTASHPVLDGGPRLSSRTRGWEGIVVEQGRVRPRGEGVVTRDGHLIGFVLDRRVPLTVAVADRRHEGIYCPGDLVICPAGQPVRWALDGVWDGLVVAICPEVVRGAARDLGADPARVELLGRPRARDPLIVQIGQALLAALREASVGERLYVESLRNALAVHLLRHHSSLTRGAPMRTASRGLPEAKLRRAINAIHDHLEVGISLGQLAEVTGVSPSHFEVLFKRSTGVSFYQYLLQCRVERAKQLLRAENLSLVQVAAQAGFCDQGHLARHFKKIVGVTPSDYRKES